jgi:hypothetical protein
VCSGYNEQTTMSYLQFFFFLFFFFDQGQILDYLFSFMNDLVATLESLFFVLICSVLGHLRLLQIIDILCNPGQYRIKMQKVTKGACN